MKFKSPPAHEFCKWKQFFFMTPWMVAFNENYTHPYNYYNKYFSASSSHQNKNEGLRHENIINLSSINNLS